MIFKHVESSVSIKLAQLTFRGVVVSPEGQESCSRPRKSVIRLSKN